MRADLLLWTFLFALLALGVFTVTAPITFHSLSIMFALVVGHYWARAVLRQVRVSLEMDADRSQVGERVHLEVRVDNPTVLPLPWVEISIPLPGRGLVPSAPDREPGASRGMIRIRTGLAWFERLVRDYSLVCTRRGYHRISPPTVRVWDPLGLTFLEAPAAGGTECTVYPLLTEIPRLDIDAETPFGRPDRQRWLFLDPLSVAGARPYQPQDPVRLVHWPATAAHDRLMTRVLEGTYGGDVSVLLNLHTLPVSWQGTIPELLELSITAAASVARWAARRGFRVGLHSNGSISKRTAEDSAPLLTVPASSHPRQLRRILESLARCSGYGREPFATAVNRHIQRLSFQTCCVVITAVMTDDTFAVLRRLAAQGHPVTVLYTGEPPSPAPPQQVSLHSLGGRRRWRNIAGRYAGINY